MAKNKNKGNEEIPKPTEDIKVDKPRFNDTLSAMIKKKVDPNEVSKKKKY
ncbi:hypothetical protein KIH23_10140 [Flavobacterium sp. CYK-55]|nr:hypothetical protein [Flavobacterium sp. CYK-55]MBS7787657.1 hypothetical protein [Flavobacterium sp. CYK-55]